MAHKMVLYYGNALVEPSVSFYIPNAATGSGSIADEVAESLTGFLHSSISFTKWERYNELGNKIDTGTLNNLGVNVGEILPITYCIYLVKLSESAGGRPSTNYVHGIVETAMTNGLPSAGTASSVVAYGIALLNVGALDDEGQPLTGVRFGHFSRRRRVRRKPL